MAAGDVSIVLAQDRDRIAREPAYHYLLRREFEERGCILRALNDRGDGSPEGELTDGIVDQLAKFERAKIAERSRRGKLRKAREGKIVAGHTPNFGFRYNASRDGYEVHEEAMGVVVRVFRMVGVEGVSTHSVTKILESEGVPSPSGGRYWDKRIIKRMILDDVYKPHAFKEISDLVAPEVAARLDPEKRYGVWWFNRRHTTTQQVSESGPGGRTYRRRSQVSFRDRREWIAVPVLDSGVPTEWVEAARAAIAEYRSSSKLGGRSWELSGALLRCGECGRAMEPVDRHYKTKAGRKGVICYYRCREGNRRRQICSNTKSIRSDKAHPAVWDLVSGLLSDPQRLREGLETVIEEQRRALRGSDPEREEKAWLEKLASLDRKRGGYLDLAAEGIMGRDELRAKLAEVQEVRETVEEELAASKGRRERIERMERDRDAVLETYAGAVHEGLDTLTPEERHRVYKMLRLEVLAYPDKSLVVSGAIVAEVGTDPRGRGGATPRDEKLGAQELMPTS